MSGAPIAIVGMACRFPGAPDVDAYWRNILGKVDAVSDPPPEAWDTDVYYDPGFEDTDKTYCKRGGYLGSLVAFDPLAHGIPPLAVGGEPDQWLALDVATEALADAGCDDLPESVRARTGIVLGKGTYLNGGNAIAVQRGLIVDQTLALIRRLHPEHSDDDLHRLREEMKRALPALGPERVAGLIPNIIVGRIANRLDLMGPTYTVDAACASSLVAVELAIRDLRDGTCDLALAGGSQVWMPVPTLSLFCQLGALSRSEQIRPFDADADGTLLGEGIGMVVLKRLDDARRDGDRVYAAIRGVGVASDGRGTSVMAPRPEGEVLALRRAYEEAGLDPATVGLVEAHGTGTEVGDVVEVQALTAVFGERSGTLARCALGTVKSMISHTIPAAGVAGLIKVALALHHRVLPPTLHCDHPNPKLELERTQFYVNTETRPWIHGGREPRRAGINAFGFGGINAHAVLEDAGEATTRDHLPPWDSEVVVLEAETAAGLVEQAARLAAGLAPEPRGYTLTALAATLGRRVGRIARPVRLANVADSFDDLRGKLAKAVERLEQPNCRRIKGASGIYYAADPLARDGTVVLVFPGEGAQYPNMLADLCVHFPEVRDAFDQVDRIYWGHPRGHLSSDWVFPRPAFSDDERRAAETRLMQMDIAVEAVLSANEAVHRLLQRLGLRAGACVGHSTGEFSAAHAAGVLQIDDEEQRARFSEGLYACYADASARDDVPKAVLLAVAAERDQVEAIAREAGGEVAVAMDNCPHQAVLVGEPAAAERARAILVRDGLIHERLPYDRAVHTPRFAAFADRLRAVFAATDVAAPHTPLYSCTTAGRCPDDAAAIRELLVEHWVSPVEFRRTIETLHDEGARVFVECGPRGNLTAFIEDILRGREFCAVPADVQRRSGTRQLNHLVAMLLAHGVDLDLDGLFAGRADDDADWDRAPAEIAPAPPSRVVLATRWPMLRLSDSAVAALRPPAAVEPEPDGVAVALAVAPSEAGGLEDAVGGHLRTMHQFLSTQQEIMQAFLSAPGPASHPLLGEVTSFVPGVELVARRVVDPGSDPYLDDHRLGGGLAIMPLAMSLAILAEAAAELVPELGVTGLRDVRAHRWLAFGDDPQEIEVRATVADGDETAGCRVHVELRNLTEDADAAAPAPVVEATVLLGTALPAPPAPLPALADPRPSRWRVDQLYREVMFHGPRWQGVRSLETTSDRGARARLEVLPVDGFLRDAALPELALDPVVLDAAGQVIGFWTAERLDRGKVVFPFALAALDLHGPPPAVGEPIVCSADIKLVGDQLVRSDIDVRDAAGRAWMRLSAWQDKRFDVPDEHVALIVGDGRATMSSEWPVAANGRLRCRRLTARLPADGGPWVGVWAHRVLSRSERAAFAALRLPDRRRLEWLAARTAAKEAVQALVREHAGRELALAEIEILNDESGRPIVRVNALDDLAPGLSVSLSHSDGEAAAVAALGESVGIDIERLQARPEGFDDAAFGPDERALLADLDDEWVLRCWCAKEAAAKALGRGLLGRPRDAAVVSVDRTTGRIAVRLAGEALVAGSRRDGDLIVATTPCERKEVDHDG